MPRRMWSSEKQTLRSVRGPRATGRGSGGPAALERSLTRFTSDLFGAFCADVRPQCTADPFIGGSLDDERVEQESEAGCGLDEAQRASKRAS